jgi:hypothetical protein
MSWDRFLGVTPTNERSGRDAPDDTFLFKMQRLK